MVSSFSLLVLGIVAGLVAVAAPGPISMTVVEIGVARGRRSGVQASIGAFSADVFLAPIAVATVTAGATLPAGFFVGLQLVSVMTLIVLGVILIARPTSCQALAANIANPGRALFALGTMSPSVFGAWLAMLLAMPFSDDPVKLGWFAAGVVVASLAYNAVLGLAAGTVGPRLSPARRVGLSRAGGAAMLLLGAAASAPFIGVI